MLLALFAVWLTFVLISPSTPQGYYPAASSAVLSDPYANLTGYEDYLNAMYHGAVGGFPSAGFTPPVYAKSGGDYYDEWMDDAGKILSAETILGNARYGGYAASFIMRNTLDVNGFLYLPQRIVNTSFSFLQVNGTTANEYYQSTFNPFINAYFGLEFRDSAGVYEPYAWTPYSSGSGSAYALFQGAKAVEGNWTAYTSTGGVGGAAFSQGFRVNTADFYAHFDQGVTKPSGGDLITGNITAPYTTTDYSSALTGLASGKTATWIYDTWPTFYTSFTVASGPSIVFHLWINANVSSVSATLGVQVNQICNGYTTQTNPWAGVSTPITITAATQEYTLADPTAAAGQYTVPAGCALRFIVYVTPSGNTAPVTVYVHYGSVEHSTYVSVPFLSTLNLLAAANHRYRGFGILIRPLAPTNSAAGLYVALITSAGSDVFVEGGVNTADIPGLVAPVTTIPLGMPSGYYFDPPADNQSFYTFDFNATSAFANLAASNPDAVLQSLEFGVTSTTGYNLTVGWGSVHVWVAPPMESLLPPPSATQESSRGFWYAANALIDFANTSYFQGANVYEQNLVFGEETADMADTFAPYLGNPDLMSQSPFVASLFPFDVESNATGYYTTVALPYNYATQPPAYRVYESGGGGNPIHLDFLVAVSGYANLYAWSNVTLLPGADYFTVSESIRNYGVAPVNVSALSLGVGAFSPFMWYNPWLVWLEYPNGTVTEQQFRPYCPCTGGDSSDSYNAPTLPIWNTAHGGVPPPQEMLVTGINSAVPAENTNGALLKFLNYTDLQEIRYEPTIFGHSIRIGFVVDKGKGAVLREGQSTPVYKVQITPLIRTMYTQPRVLFAVFSHALATPGWDASMPATWGYDTYGLAYYGTVFDNQTVLSFARQLWNSQYRDVSRRAFGYYDALNATTLHTHAYYRALYSFTTAGLMLFPGNHTVVDWALKVFRQGMVGVVDPYGLPVSQEEYGWAADMLAHLYPYVSSNSTLAAQIDSFETFLLDSNSYNETYIPHTVSQWPSGYTIKDFSPYTFSPSVWSDNKTGAPVFWVNHPLYAYKAGEMLFGFMAAAQVPGFTQNYWNDPRILTLATLLWEFSDKRPTGIAVYADDVGNRGNSNTEVQPDGILGLAAWMQAQYLETGGVFLARVVGAGVKSAQWVYNPQPRATNYYVVTLSMPPTAGATATVYFNAGGYPQSDIYVEDNGVNVTWSYNTASHDVIVQGVSGTVTIALHHALEAGGRNPGVPTQGVCSPGNLPPTPLQQFEDGCVLPGVIDTYAGTGLGVPLVVAFMYAILAGMIYLKSQNSLLALIVVLFALPTIGYLIPAPAQTILYVFFVVAVAAVLYFAFTKR